MMQITLEIPTEEDIDSAVKAAVDAEMLMWVEWSNTIAQEVQGLTARTVQLETNLVKTNKQVNALKSRVLALEEASASGTYNDSY